MSLPGPASAPVEWKKPGPKPWAMAEQWTFLKGGVPGYCTAQAAKGKNATIVMFLSKFMLMFWAQFLLQGDRTAAMDCKHIREWFQNHSKKSVTPARIDNIFPKTRSCALKAEEIYLHQYYVKRIKPLVDERKTEINTTKEVFEAESEDVQAEVMKWKDEQEPLLVMKDGVITPEIALAAAPDQIKRFMAALSKVTSWVMMTIIGGPDPWEKGKISTYGGSVGAEIDSRESGKEKDKETNTNKGNGIDMEINAADNNKDGIPVREAGASKSPPSPPLPTSLPSPLTMEFEDILPPNLVVDEPVMNKDNGIDMENNATNNNKDSFPVKEAGASKSLPSPSPLMSCSKTHKCQSTLVKDGLTATWVKRVHSGPVPKEILTLAEHAGLEGGIIAAPKTSKHRTRKT
ncbi:uncharacterized protein EV420DRAFT_1646215 [Desarmillaria tabescens]|uniref:Uncharacterized protein n=1 Tax=Armillaria tabescens TaxID=1929756 RepID=A0AA39JY80_ARMTA|nr:uncharacterized protein EV420DRAFT_1646215 [Desarmillaria tabescens]KAK0451132.1 hypothetical protein EV420DRAFT_1646215 [Desarmillaria tabescens]